eukprot:783189-Rhodomonas_salina.1
MILRTCGTKLRYAATLAPWYQSTVCRYAYMVLKPGMLLQTRRRKRTDDEVNANSVLDPRP